MASDLLDLDQLHTFISIVDTGSFTRAADEVHRTQSAVSMQMRRLEDRIGKALFEKEGRMNKLTEEGERLLTYARRLLHLNRETLAAFDDKALEGTVRIGVPDDYADRFLPEIMARFSRSNPRVELSVLCEPTVNLADQIRRGNLDIALVTQCEDTRPSEIVRNEPLLWVSSASHMVHEEPILPMAFGRPTCQWRQMATERLQASGREHRVLFTSWSANVSPPPCWLASPYQCCPNARCGRACACLAKPTALAPCPIARSEFCAATPAGRRSSTRWRGISRRASTTSRCR